MHDISKLASAMLQENLQQRLTDEKARDQFVIHAATFTEVFWNDTRQLMPNLVYHRKHLFYSQNLFVVQVSSKIRNLYLKESECDLFVIARIF